jgi:mannitol/fructose-specific phosphotransferase system IIA component (Ntr-type)
MHPVVNHLVQLQELVLIRDETKIATAGKDLERLDRSIDGMTGELPQETRVMFEKLYNKDHTVIVSVSEGICAACGLRLPISLVQAVKLAKSILHCPSCARFLYFAPSLPKRLGAASRRSDPPKLGIARFSAEALMLPRLKAQTAPESIHELAGLMQSAGFVDDAGKLAQEAIRREEIMSTAVEHGLAFPHVRRVEGGGLTLALGISPKGIRFSAGGKSLTRIVFFLLIPTAASAFYLKLLAGLAETFADAEQRQSLLKPEAPKELWKALVKATRATVK